MVRWVAKYLVGRVVGKLESAKLNSKIKPEVEVNVGVLLLPGLGEWLAGRMFEN